jgi:HAUS augmin-like complex subunit 1
MAHLSPSAIFSPSVARQQLAAAKDWNYIDSWLSTKFGGKTPPFERNNDTLKTLLAVAALNESADEERELISRVELNALHDFQTKEEADPNTKLVEFLGASLTREGQTSLEAMSTISETLNQPPVVSIENLGRSIIDLQVSLNGLDQASDRISILEKHLDTALDRINDLVEDLQSDSYQAPPDVMKQIIDYQRKTKVLAGKLPELKDRVASLVASMGTSITVMDVKVEEDRFRAMMATVKDLEAQVRSYHGLPQDTDLARLELEGVRVELRDLTRERDSMFEGLVERESPKRTRSKR